MRTRDPTAGFNRHAVVHVPPAQRRLFRPPSPAPPLSDADLLRMARGLLELAPQLEFGFPGGIADDVLVRAIYKESVATLDGLPDRWLGRAESLFDDPSRPLFRFRYAALATPDADDRAGFLLVQVVHALVEGADSALLSRSQSAVHPLSLSTRRTAPLVKATATGLGAVLAALHLLAGNLLTAHPRPVPRRHPRLSARDLFVARPRPRRAPALAAVRARACNAVRQRHLGRQASYQLDLFVIDDGGGADRDAFMRMRMRFAIFDTPPASPISSARSIAGSPRPRPRRAASMPSSTPKASACTAG